MRSGWAEGETGARAPPSASVSPDAEAPPLAPRPGLLCCALRPPTQGPHLEPSAPQEARLVHGPLVRTARPAPGPAPTCQAPPPRAIGQAGQLMWPGPAPPSEPSWKGPASIGSPDRPSRPHPTPPAKMKTFFSPMNSPRSKGTLSSPLYR